MEGAVIFALILLVAGLLFSWLAVLGWRHRNEDMISFIEAAILKTTGAEPLPLRPLDRWIQRFQLVMMSVFGPTLIVVGTWWLLSELGVS